MVTSVKKGRILRYSQKQLFVSKTTHIVQSKSFSQEYWCLTIWWSKSQCWSVKSGKITKVLVIRIILVLVLVSFAESFELLFSYSYENFLVIITVLVN